MYISFRKVGLPDNYKIGPYNVDNLIRDIAYVKQKVGGFQTLEGVDIQDHSHYKEYIFFDDILPLEVVINTDRVSAPLLTKVLHIKNQERYRVKNYRVVTVANNVATRIYLDVEFHPHVDLTKKYCAPPFVLTGPFTSLKFEKLRTSLHRWNLARCYKEHVPPKEDFVLTPLFSED